MPMQKLFIMYPCMNTANFNIMNFKNLNHVKGLCLYISRIVNKLMYIWSEFSNVEHFAGFEVFTAVTEKLRLLGCYTVWL
jgi:hypothetical protein